MTFTEYLKQREADLIKIVGEKTWMEEKVYFVDEIFEFVSGWLASDTKSTSAKQSTENVFSYGEAHEHYLEWAQDTPYRCDVLRYIKPVIIATGETLKDGVAITVASFYGVTKEEAISNAALFVDAKNSSHQQQKEDIPVNSKQKKEKGTVISDLLTIIHETVIKNTGASVIEIEKLGNLISDNKLQDYSVETNSFFKFILRKSSAPKPKLTPAENEIIERLLNVADQSDFFEDKFPKGCKKNEDVWQVITKIRAKMKSAFA